MHHKDRTNRFEDGTRGSGIPFEAESHNHQLPLCPWSAVTGVLSISCCACSARFEPMCESLPPLAAARCSALGPAS
jgi:hypothetical protein